MKKETAPLTFATKIDIALIVRRLPRYAKLTWLLMRDPDLTAKQRAALVAAIGYAISPIDAIPGIIPVVGQLDDLAIVLFTLRWVLNSIPQERSNAYCTKAGLSTEILEQDFDLVSKTGVRILRKTAAALGIATLWAVATGKVVRKEIKRNWDNRKSLPKDSNS